MGQVLWSLELGLEANTFPLMRELSAEHEREAYQIAADELAYGMSALGGSFDSRGGCFLIMLANKSLVALPYTGAYMQDSN